MACKRSTYYLIMVEYDVEPEYDDVERTVWTPCLRDVRDAPFGTQEIASYRDLDKAKEVMADWQRRFPLATYKVEAVKVV